MKTYIAVVTVVVMGVVGSSVAGTYGGGSGTPEDPYQIWDANHMQAIGAEPNDWDKHFVLMADVDLSQFDGKDGREEFNIIGEAYSAETWPFSGVFDGSDHTISNFSYDSNDRDCIGLFGQVGSSGEIRKVGLIDPNVSGGTGNWVGSLVGNGSITTNCYVRGGSVSGDICVGGLVGASGLITDSYAEGTSVVGSKHVGGLVGSGTTIIDCHATGSVTGENEVGGLAGDNGYAIGCYATGKVVGNVNVGGLSGYSCGGEISDSWATGDVEGLGENVGGLVGSNSRGSSVVKCHSSGFVSGTDYVGALVGHNLETISNSYSTGSVVGTGKCIGGLVGRNYGGIGKCYSVGEVTGVNYVGGLMGKNDGVVGSNFWDVQTSGWATSTGGIPKTTSEMKSQSTFANAGWDFISVWNIGENQTYPYLRTHFASDINKDNITNFLDLCIVAEQWMEEE